MKILISTVYSENYDDVAASTVPNHLGYCRKHGYEYNVHHAPWGAKSVYYNGYLVFVREMLQHYDTIVMIDLDLLFMDWSITIESIFYGCEQQIAEEKLCETSSPINAGIVIFKNSHSSRVLLDEILRKKPQYEKDPLAWQAHLVNMIKSDAPEVRNLKIVPARVMNSHWNSGFPPSYVEGDFIIHFYMMSDHSKKAALCKEYSEKAKK